MKKIMVFAGMLVVPAAVSVGQGAARITINQDDPRLVRLQQFFMERGCPLHSSAVDFLVAADENGLDWRLLPSLSMIESSGGKDYSKNNVFGWDSCKGGFASIAAGIHFVADRLANSKTYRYKKLEEKLRIYNPVPHYPERVKAVMASLSSN